MTGTENRYQARTSWTGAGCMGVWDAKRNRWIRDGLHTSDADDQ